MNRTILASCSLCGLLVAATAHAQLANTGPALNATPSGTRGQNQSQGAAAPNEPSGGGQLETIVVTAQKRTEVVQKVPAPIATISLATLSRAGVRDFTDIEKGLPDVHVDDAGGSVNIAIRGLRESATGPTSDSPTAVHLDGVYLSRATSFPGLFYDLQRIEELPGPQGTLYGRNATGGVLNLITNKPSDKFGGYVEAEGGSYGLYRFQGAINVPVSDILSVRGAFHILKNDGYFSDGYSNTDQKGGRISARLKLNPDATLLVTADYQDSQSHGAGSALLLNSYPSLYYVLPNVFPIQTTPRPSNPFQINPALYPAGVGFSVANALTYGAMAELDYNLGAATLTAQFGLRKYYGQNNAYNLGPLPPGAPLAALGDSVAPAFSTTYSGEIRLASNSKLPFEWVAGLYYFTEKNGGQLCAYQFIGDTSCGLKIANPFQRTLSYAVFGQGTYTPPILSEKLHLTFGARYNQDKKNASVYTQAGFAITPTNPTGTLDSEPNLDATFQATTYLARLSYDITPSNLIYVSNSTGFRAGGFAYGLTPEYKPESIQAYEIGLKNRFLNDTLQVNVSAYHYIYKNQETNVASSPPIGSGLPFSDLSVQSIGKTHYTGVGLDVEYAVTPNDRVELNVQYEDAHYVRFQIPPIYQTSVPLGLNGFPTNDKPGSQAGLQVINTPPYSGTFAYDHSLDAFGGVFDGRAAVQFSDTRHFIPFPIDTLQYKYGSNPPYARLDLSVGYTPDRGNWKVLGYVNNVTNAYTYTGNLYEGTFGSGQFTAELLPPRTYGVIVSAKF